MSDRTQPSDLARELWLLWRRGPPPDVRRLLDRAGDLAPAQVAAALRVDQRERWRIGDRVPAADYLRDWPALRADPEAALEVIYGELLLREELGEPPASEEYLRAYPEYAEPLRLLVELHRALGATSGPGADVTATGPSAVTLRAMPVGVPGLPPAPPSGVCPAGYELLAELGRGGMGVVYRAYDRNRGELVALKTVQRADPAALYRFKREFRALADVAHPNLVHLYELNTDGEEWFLTMELVEGVNFLEYVRAPVDGPDPATAEESPGPVRSPTGIPLPDTERTGDLTASATRPGEAGPPTAPHPVGGLKRFQSVRLRAALRQLAEGVTALHDAGKLHRDLKPSNVLVTRRGRVVILDFGLAAELDRTGIHRSSEGHVLGTVAYMAPEQAAGEPVSPASDWYSVGAMLYEALTGRTPFLGGPLEVLMAKRRVEPPAPRELVLDLPKDLDALCVDLLRRDPAARPSGRGVLRHPGIAPAGSGPATDPPPTPAPGGLRLLGRAPHLTALADALTDVKRGRAVVLLAHGPSGVGKSALVQHFLDDLAEPGGPVVLAGRCYEREAVPYKALDSLIDALGRYLKRLPQPEALALLPRDLGPLTQVFPVLRQAEAVAMAPRRPAQFPDPAELRRRAFVALRELLARLGDRRPLVLSIDDLQWGDADSAAVLSELLRPPDPPALLLLGCYRSEDAAASPLLRALRAALAGAPSASLDCRELALEALAGPEAEALALMLLGHDDPFARARAAAFARESGGNPFFVHELVRHHQAVGASTPQPEGVGASTLDEVLWARIRRLPGGARRLLEVVAVSGRPLGQAEACRAAGLERDGRSTLAVLRCGRLIRGTGATDRGEVETYHDRVREAVVARLDPATSAGHHLRLAEALEATGRADPEVLATHLREADQPRRAGDYYAVAAARAAEALAFDRAATLYRLALESLPPGDPRGPELRTRRADALANAGRGGEAAREYLAAAGGATVAAALELRRRAALQLLISGHIDEGLAALRAVLGAVGMDVPSTPRRALGSLLLRRLRVRLRGLGFRRRDTGQIAAEELTRVDICWSAAVGLSLVDPIRGADFQARHLLLALRAGDPGRIARSLALEGMHGAVAGESGRRRAERYLRMAQELAHRVGDPHALGLAALGTGYAFFLLGHFERARGAAERAEELFHGRCTGVAWELATARFLQCGMLYYLGEVAELARRLPRFLGEARDRGDLYALATMGYLGSAVALAADDPEEAGRGLAAVMGPWTRQGYHIQHRNALWAAATVALYRGEGRAAWELMREQWPALEGSLILRIQFVRITMRHLRARCALAAARDDAERGALLRVARRDARRLERERTPWGTALAQLVHAGIAATQGDPSAARERLTAAVTGFEACDMRLFASAARRCLGQLVGGSEGRTLLASADSWMVGQAIRNPARMAAMLAPGFPA